ncbi:GreA/GreB family elongation factor [Fredinandcohnia humi]
MNHNLDIVTSETFFRDQLRYIDENIQDLTALYLSSTPVKERVKEFFSLYVYELENYLENHYKIAETNTIPKVFIGTKVTVSFDNEREIEEYLICLPHQSDPDAGLISFLSPVGRQLLLRNLDEQISLTVPSGEQPVTIQNISFFVPTNLLGT